MLSLKKRALACAVTGASFLAPGIAGRAAVTPLTQIPDQDEHHIGFTNTDKCDPVKGVKRHPREQWITDEWDRYNDTNPFTSHTDHPIQYTLEATEGINESAKVTSSGSMWDVFLHEAKNKYGIVEVSQWSVDDKLGPVAVNPDEIARADYGVYMESFIDRVHTCDQKTGLWRDGPYFGEYNGKRPSTRFVVWHKATKEGERRQQWASVSGNSDNGGPASATIND